MKKWIWKSDGMFPNEHGYWYDTTEVDARIAELEKALRDVRGELQSYSGLKAEHQDWSDAFAVIDTALMVR